MIVIGERLNSTRKPVMKALLNRDEKFIIREALEQEKAGAHFVDLNSAVLLEHEISALEWAVPLLQKHLSIPIAIDTPNLKSMEKALILHKGQALFNSLTGEIQKIESALPLLKEYNPQVIVLCMNDKGVPSDAKGELHIAQKAVDYLTKSGICIENIFLDPLVRTIGADQRSGLLFLEALSLLKSKLPEVKTIAGISNVSFGLPNRRLINRTFLSLAIQAGLDACIIDPLDTKMIDSIKAANGILNKDEMLIDYITHFRSKKR